VLSHPQALAQCSEWLSEYLPNAISLPTNSTSEAVNMVKGSKFRAAIGSKSLIKIEGLKELAFPINDVPGNCTRFVLLSKESSSESANIASFAFSLISNKPGALLEAVNFIANFGFNMSKIESRPSKRELGEYIIYIDLEINNQNNIENFLELKNKLYGFVRVTSDRGLNANLWNLSALPGNNQQLYYSILIQVTLEKINREMPGCSISVQAPVSSFISLEENGFILDPNGIRVMGYKL